MRRDFNTIVIIGGGRLNTEAMGLENEDFSDEDQCQCMYTWEFFGYIPTRVFDFFFLHYCHRYHWYYLKGCFVILCFKSAEVLKFVKICQKEVLSEERQLTKWVRIFQVRIFWVAFFRGGNFPGGSLMGGTFSWVNSPVGIFLEIFSSYNASILIFQKIINKN